MCTRLCSSSLSQNLDARRPYYPPLTVLEWGESSGNSYGCAFYIDGKLSASSPLGQETYDVANRQPLRIGFGPGDYFSGRIREVRLHRRAIGEGDIRRLATARPL